MNLADTRELLDRRGLRLRRELGQNFLVDPGWAQRLVELSGIAPGDSVLEVGTGLGALTRALAARAGKILTLEIDSGVARALREEKLLPERAELLHADALRVDLAELAAGLGPAPVRLVANLPYSSATPLLRVLLDLRDHFTDWSVMVQREMAARLAASPGSRDYGSLAVLHALTAHVGVLAEVPAACFFPVPRVVSSFVRIEPARCELQAAPPHPPSAPGSPPVSPAASQPVSRAVSPPVSGPLSVAELARVERVTRAVFGQRRKTIFNGLRSGSFGPPGADRDAREAALRVALAAAGIDARARAETVDPLRLLALTRALLPGDA